MDANGRQSFYHRFGRRHQVEEGSKYNEVLTLMAVWCTSAKLSKVARAERPTFPSRPHGPVLFSLPGDEPSARFHLWKLLEREALEVVTASALLRAAGGSFQLCFWLHQVLESHLLLSGMARDVSKHGLGAEGPQGSLRRPFARTGAVHIDKGIPLHGLVL